MLRLASCLIVLLLGLLAGCTGQAEAILDRAIAQHGGDELEHAVVEFDFRDAHFIVQRDGGTFQYERHYTDSTGAVREVLNNDGLFREVNGERVPLSDAARRQVETAVNSVVYFALLPSPLSDPAVQPRYLGTTTIDGEPYHEIEVTFRQEGGGRDWEDRFVYWIHRDRSTMDYLAYRFHTGDGGTRFREAYDVRTIGGVRFADYRNYTSESLGTAIERYDTWPDDLRLVSNVELENVVVRPHHP